MKKRTGRQGKETLSVMATVFLVVLGFGYSSIKESAYAIDISEPSKKVETKRYLEVSWPASKNRGAITFVIPEEYLHASTTWRNKDGSIKSFAIQFELPGPIPVQNRPWLKGKKGTPEYEEFMKTWQGRFSMDVEPLALGSYKYRGAMRNSALEAGLKVDVGISGLERYSRLECFSEHDLSKDGIKKIISSKGSDDVSPANCRLDRRWAVLISPEEVNKDDEGVGIRCSSTGCKAYFSIAGCGVSMGIAHKDIEDWPAVIEPARALVKSFIGNNT